MSATSYHQRNCHTLLVLLLFALILFSTSQNVVDPSWTSGPSAFCLSTPFPNTRLGFGYDTIRGDPGITTNTIDPGIKAPVFRTDVFDAEGVAIDQEFAYCAKPIGYMSAYVPNGFLVHGFTEPTVYYPGCSAYKSNVMTSAREFKQFMVDKVNVGTTFGYEFSASPGYIRAKQKETLGQLDVYTWRSCPTFKLKYTTMPTIRRVEPVTNEFSAAVRGLDIEGASLDRLRKSYNEASQRVKMLQLYNAFGTSVIIGTTHGQVDVRRVTVGDSVFAAMKAWNLPIDLQSGDIASALYQRGMSTTTVENSTVDGSYYVGTTSSTEYGASNLRNLATKKPLPYSLQLIPITDVMTTRYLSNFDSDRLAAIKQAYESFARVHLCSMVPGCSLAEGPELPEPNPSTPYIDSMTTRKIGGEGGYAQNTAIAPHGAKISGLQCKYIPSGPVEAILIRFSDGSSATVGNPDSVQTTTTLASFGPNEYITSVSYKTGWYGNANVVLKLLFKSNAGLEFSCGDVTVATDTKFTQLDPEGAFYVTGFYSKHGWYMDQLRVYYISPFANAPVRTPMINYHLSQVNGVSGFAEPRAYAIGDLCFLFGAFSSPDLASEGTNIMSVYGNCRSGNGRLILKAGGIPVSRVDVVDGTILQWVHSVNSQSNSLNFVSLSGTIYPSGNLVDLPMANGWTKYDDIYGKPSITIQHGICVLSGVVKGTFLNTAVKIATLPDSCRPQARLIFTVEQSGTLARVDVHANGDVVLSNDANWLPQDAPTWLTLTGIQFTLTPFYEGIEFLGGWVNYGGSWHMVSVNVIDGFCILNGLIKHTTFNNQLLRLPVNCRPQQRMSFLTFGGREAIQLDVYPSGEVKHNS